jgi:hypothetical protein
MVPAYSIPLDVVGNYVHLLRTLSSLEYQRVIYTTKIVLLLTVIILMLYDIVAYKVGGPEATISNVIVKLSESEAIIPFAAGLLCGHLFWRL